MELPLLQTKLLAEHHGKSQDCLEITHGLALVGEGLRMLGRLGHLYHLEDGPPTALPEWPKIMFHVDSAPNGRVVNSEWDLADLGDGWFSTIQEAQHWDGVATQFAGRGGVSRRDLPMVILGSNGSDHAPTDNSDIIAAWKRMRDHGPE